MNRLSESTEGASDHASGEREAIIHAVEPPSVLVIGGLLGGATFLFCAFLFGARTAIVIAAVGALVALVRRLPIAAIAFALAAAIAAAAATAALLAASAIFGAALALFALARMRARVAAAMDRVSAGRRGGER